MTAIAKQLNQNLEQSAFFVDQSIRDQLVRYLQLLIKWNKAYNLTAVRDPLQMVARHIMDSLSIASYVKGQRVLDVGSGAGLPGIPLALCFPEHDFTLLDSNGKKTRFMVQVAKELGLGNVSVVKKRVSSYRPESIFDTIVARAFSTVANLVSESTHLLGENSQVLAMKGTYPLAELDELGSDVGDVEVTRLEVPGVDAERHLVIVNGFANEVCQSK